MTIHNHFDDPYASFTGAWLPLLKVAALSFDKLMILDPVGASRDTVGADAWSEDTSAESQVCTAEGYDNADEQVCYAY